MAELGRGEVLLLVDDGFNDISEFGGPRQHARRRYLTFSAAWVRIRSTVHVTRTIRLTTAGGQVPPAESLLHSEGVPSP